MSDENNHEKIPSYIVEKNNQFSVECQIQRAQNCHKNGDFCDSHQEAQDWVEGECWIFSGEGWICVTCTEYIVMNLAKTRKRKEPDRRDDDLEVGIDTVR